MSEQNKDNISQFFRKTVQKPKIRFVESDWEKLEARLDAASAASSPKHNHWKTAFIAAVALLFVTTSLLFYNGRQANTTSKKNEANNVNADNTSSTQSSTKNEILSSEKQELKIPTAKTPDKSTVHTSHLTNAKTKDNKAPLMKSNAELNEEHNTSLQSDQKNKAAIFQDTLSQDKVNKAAVITQSPDKEISSQSLPVDSCSEEEQKDDVVKKNKNRNDSLAESVKSKPSRWNIMLSISPDFSSTDLDKFTTPGNAFGITAYHAINQAFSISAGVVKSNKLYWDSGDEYKPADPGFWAKKTHGVVPTKIEGSCSVLEIPIGLQYYAVSTRKHKLYLASTFSSYIMLKESYHYIFDSPNPGASQSWNAKKTSYSLFSIANLAVGYERSISNRLMIGFSPYIKIPMSGIGAWANVKLYSTGAAFTLRYQFQKKKKPDRLIPAD
jgi:hypothetical protein